MTTVKEIESAVKPLPKDRLLEFRTRLDLFPREAEFDRAYIEKAKVRGWKTFEHLPQGTGTERLLDVGSMSAMYGPAYVDLWGYREVCVIGTDAPPGGVITRTGPNGRTYSFPAFNCNIELQPWPFPDSHFQTVVCTEVLEHMIFDPVFVMNEISRVLIPGGHTLITIPNAASDSSLTFLVNSMQPGFLRNYLSDALKTGRRDLDVVYNLGHFHEYTSPELAALARETGFEILFLKGITFFPPMLNSLQFKLLRAAAHLLFPRSQRVREDHLIALLRKRTYTPLDQLKDRYPQPLYRPLTA